MKRESTVALAAIACAALALYWLMGSDAAGSVNTSLAKSNEGARVERDPGADSRSADPDASATPRTEPREAAPPADKPAPPEPGAIRVEGTIVVVDPQGLRHEGTSGKLQLMLRGATVRFTNCKVRQGRWSADALPGDRIKGLRATLDDRPVLLARDEHEVVESEGAVAPLRLTGRWLGETPIHVVDVDTREHLRGLDVVRVREYWRDGFRHPGEKFTRVLRDAASPFALPEARPAREESKIWIRAPGYAWDQLVVRHGPKNVRELRLQRGGGVDVVFTRRAPRATTLRLRRISAERPTKLVSRSMPTTSFKPGSRSVLHVRDIRPGTYEISLERGHWFDNPISIARTRANIRANAIESVTLRVEDVPEPRSATLRGSVLLPAEWKAKSAALTIDGIGETSSVARRTSFSELVERTPGEYVFEVSLPEGAYQLVVRPSHARFRVTHAQGNPAHRIVVPPPAEVVVRCVDRETRQAIHPTNVAWHTPRPKGVNAWSTESAVVDASGLARFRAPIGKVVLQASAKGYASDYSNREHELRHGHNEITIPLQRMCGVVITLTLGEAQVPWQGFSAQLSKDGESVMRYFSGAKITSKAPGNFELSLRTPDGFEPVAKRSVTVRAGEYTKVAIALTRKR